MLKLAFSMQITGRFHQWHRTATSIKDLGFTKACAAVSKLCSLKERNFQIAQTTPDSQQNGSPPAKNGFRELLNFPALKRGATPPHSLFLWGRPMRDSRKADADRVGVQV